MSLALQNDHRLCWPAIASTVVALAVACVLFATLAGCPSSPPGPTVQPAPSAEAPNKLRTQVVLGLKLSEAALRFGATAAEQNGDGVACGVARVLTPVVTMGAEVFSTVDDLKAHRTTHGEFPALSFDLSPCMAIGLPAVRLQVDEQVVAQVGSSADLIASSLDAFGPVYATRDCEGFTIARALVVYIGGAARPIGDALAGTGKGTVPASPFDLSSCAAAAAPAPSL